MGVSLPSGAELEEEVDIVGGFREVSELDDVGVVYGLPGLDLVLEGVDEVLLGEGLVLGEVDLVDQVLLLDHLARQHLPRLRLYRQVGLREGALAQLAVLDRVVTVDHLESV